MNVPENTEVYETPTSTYWFDKDGILCSVSKKRAPLSLEETKKVMEEFKKNLRQEKTCLLIDVTNSTPTTREIRDYAAIEFPKFVKAIAMVSDSALGKMLANLFFNIVSQPYPVKMFTNEKEAKKWLKQYL